MQRNAGTGDDLRLVQKHQAETKHWVAEGTPWIYKLLKLKTAFLMDFCIEYPYGYSTRNDRIKLKVGTGNTGSFFCGGWMHWEIPAALYRARKCLPALYLRFRRTPPAMFHFYILPTRAAHGRLDRQQARWRPENPSLHLDMSHNGAHETSPKLLPSGSPEDSRWVNSTARGDKTTQKSWHAAKQGDDAGWIKRWSIPVRKVYGRTLMGAWWSLGAD